jgi:hypothetical protein
LEVYNENRSNIHRTALEADLFSSSLLDWFKDNDEWEGKASQLLRVIEEHACGYEEKKIEALRRQKSWPADGTRVSVRLRRLSNFLRRIGVEITFPAPTDGTRTISIKKAPRNSAHSAHSAQTQGNKGVGKCADLCTETAATASAQLAHTEKSSNCKVDSAGCAECAEERAFAKTETSERLYLFCKGYGRQIGAEVCELHRARHDKKCVGCQKAA